MVDTPHKSIFSKFHNILATLELNHKPIWSGLQSSIYIFFKVLTQPYLTPDVWLQGLGMGRSVDLLFKWRWGRGRRGWTCGLRWPYPFWRPNTLREERIFLGLFTSQQCGRGSFSFCYSGWFHVSPSPPVWCHVWMVHLAFWRYSPHHGGPSMTDVPRKDRNPLHQFLPPVLVRCRPVLPPLINFRLLGMGHRHHWENENKIGHGSKT